MTIKKTIVNKATEIEVIKKNTSDFKIGSMCTFYH